MLNESHNNTLHRMFAETLLEPLKKNGFSSIAIEAISHKDPALNERGYPILSTGALVKDPNFSNFIRSALNMGFNIITYETNNIDATINEREEDQANNIAQYIKENPTEKIFVYAGFSHIYKKHTNPKKIWMAERLKQKVKIDPYTINQTDLEKNETVKTVSIRLNSDQSFYTNNNQNDMFLVYPNKNIEVYNLLNQRLNRQKVTLQFNNKELFENTDIIEVSVENEYKKKKEKCIPFSIQKVHKSIIEYPLFLSTKNSYLILLKDTNKNIIKKIDLNNLRNTIKI